MGIQKIMMIIIDEKNENTSIVKGGGGCTTLQASIFVSTQRHSVSQFYVHMTTKINIDVVNFIIIVNVLQLKNI